MHWLFQNLGSLRSPASLSTLPERTEATTVAINLSLVKEETAGSDRSVVGLDAIPIATIELPATSRVTHSLDGSTSFIPTFPYHLICATTTRGWFSCRLE